MIMKSFAEKFCKTKVSDAKLFCVQKYFSKQRLCDIFYTEYYFAFQHKNIHVIE